MSAFSATTTALHGKGSDGTKYKDINDMWKAELGQNVDVLTTTPDITAAAPDTAVTAVSSTHATATTAATTDTPVTTDNPDASDEAAQQRKQWYQQGADYWSEADPSVNGVLGGFGYISPIDVSGSKHFLMTTLPAALREHGVTTATSPFVYGHAVDCGAGIGRVCRDLLLPLFATSDLIEQDAVYVNTAREKIPTTTTGTDGSGGAVRTGMREFITLGLQDWTPAPGHTYDCVWIQWCIGHLPDDDLVAFLRRCAASLTPTGVIVVKENLAREGFVLDRDDMSVTRSEAIFRQLFARAGMMLLCDELQQKFPKALFPVKMFAMRPTADVAPAKAAAATVAATPTN